MPFAKSGVNQNRIESLGPAIALFILSLKAGTAKGLGI
jgi:hypothetical protein